ncbi:MAG: amino acid ABC transporter permease [Candidatus Adiutrix sp.]|jgi:polar amino acid transport system permease protein|nr:amino acid ABC transporter permease [Candidatus Adiutrix sp.]
MNSSSHFTPPQLRRRAFGLFDAAVLAAALAAVSFLAWQAAADLKYGWNWSVMPQFILTRGADGSWRPGALGLGLGLTLKLSLWIAGGAAVLGLGLALGRLSGSFYWRMLSRTAVEAARNMPPVIMVFIFFFFLGSQILPWPRLIEEIRSLPPAALTTLEFAAAPSGRLAAFMSAVCALAYYEAAYFSEIFRGAVLSIDRGQWEASRCLGLSRFQQYRFIILPQAGRRAAPQLAGQFISVVKESSIVSVISLPELTFRASELSATIHQMYEVWLTAALLYFICNFGLSLLFGRLE